MDQKDLERLAILETNTNNIEKLVVRLESKLDNYATNFATKSELDQALKFRDEQIRELKEGTLWLRRTLTTAVITGSVSFISAVVLFWFKGG